MWFLPGHGVGAVVLSNVSASDAWHDAFRRRLLELLFEGRSEAEEDLAFALKDRQEAWRKEMASLDPEPGKAWLDRFVGTYANAALGKVTLRVEGNHGVLDVGEWKSIVGRKRTDDGTVTLVLTSPSRIGVELVARQDHGRTTLTLEVPQQTYVLERVVPPNR